MKLRLLPFALALGAALCTPGRAADEMSAAPPADSPAYAKLKTLLGDWSTEAEGKSVRVNYSLASAGRCVKETIHAYDHTMESFFCADGNAIVMTHYCGAGNQPRMKAKGLAADGSISFAFLDITGNANPKSGFMSDLKIVFIDADHIENTWINRVGKTKTPWVFKLTRAPAAAPQAAPAP